MRIAALLSLLLVLGACAPSVQDLPSPQPFVFSVDYDTLFDATLQTVASTRISTNFRQAGFVVAEADRETGLITAVRLGRTRTSGLGVGVRTGFSFGSGSRRGGDNHHAWLFVGLLRCERADRPGHHFRRGAPRRGGLGVTRLLEHRHRHLRPARRQRLYGRSGPAPPDGSRSCYRPVSKSRQKTNSAEVVRGGFF